MKKPASYHSLLRRDILQLIPDDRKSILSLGCGSALTEGKFRLMHDCKITGIEKHLPAIKPAAKIIDHIIHGDVNTSFESVRLDKFDCLLCLDILEHLSDPWTVLRQYASLLDYNGIVIASIPNINHHSIRARLALDIFPYEPAGILDDTHVRFFTLTEIYKLFAQAGLKIIQVNEFKTRADSIQYIVVGKPIVKKLSPAQVTIIIPTLNNLEYTKMCVESLRRNTRVEYQLIVVDNGSTDGTREWLLSQEDVLHIFNVTNLGFGPAVNQGLFCAQTPYVVVANNDIELTQDWLSHLIAHAERDDKVGLVGPMTNFVSGPQKLDIASLSRPLPIDDFTKGWYEKNKGQSREFQRLVFFCALIKREVIEKIGILDERFILGNFEDDDFCRRAIKADFKCLIAMDTFIWHHGHTTFKSENINLNTLLQKNQQIYLQKWGDNER